MAGVVCAKHFNNFDLAIRNNDSEGAWSIFCTGAESFYDNLTYGIIGAVGTHGRGAAPRFSEVDIVHKVKDPEGATAETALMKKVLNMLDQAQALSLRMKRCERQMRTWAENEILGTWLKSCLDQLLDFPLGLRLSGFSVISMFRMGPFICHLYGFLPLMLFTRCNVTLGTIWRGFGGLSENIVWKRGGVK
eukprot:8561174-Pyramimonas_sp.AAC.1